MRYALTPLLVMMMGATAAQAVLSHQPAKATSAMAAATQETEYGMPGNAKDARRIVEIRLLDTMRIEPARLRVTQGQTVRLRIRNSGVVPHEFVLGTEKEIAEHRDMMRTMPTMKSADANAASVAPGGTAELVWRFSRPGMFLYACLIPGHWEAGMQGTVTVTAAAKSK